MNLEDIILNRTVQSQEGKYYMIPLYKVFEMVTFIETESRMVALGG